MPPLPQAKGAPVHGWSSAKQTALGEDATLEERRSGLAWGLAQVSADLVLARLHGM